MSPSISMQRTPQLLEAAEHEEALQVGDVGGEFRVLAEEGQRGEEGRDELSFV